MGNDPRRPLSALHPRRFRQVLKRRKRSLAAATRSRRNCPRHKLAQFTWAIEALAGRIWTQALRKPFNMCIHRTVDQLTYIGSYARKAARVSQIVEVHFRLLG